LISLSQTTMTSLRWMRKCLERKILATKAKVKVKALGSTPLVTNGKAMLGLPLAITMNPLLPPTMRRMTLMASLQPRPSLPTSARLESGKVTSRKRRLNTPSSLRTKLSS
jgi:hypothetical protein